MLYGYPFANGGYTTLPAPVHATSTTRHVGMKTEDGEIQFHMAGPGTMHIHQRYNAQGRQEFTITSMSAETTGLPPQWPSEVSMASARSAHDQVLAVCYPPVMLPPARYSGQPRAEDPITLEEAHMLRVFLSDPTDSGIDFSRCLTLEARRRYGLD